MDKITDPLIRNWLWLMALIALTVALASWGGTAIGGAALMIVAAAKARAILRGFLHLPRAWTGAFLWPIGLFLAAVWLLHVLIPA